jgi:hypothetical protein
MRYCRQLPVERLRLIDDHGIHYQPVRETEGRTQYLAPGRRAATASPSGSPNRDDRGGITRRAQAGTADVRQQFALQRSMAPFSALAQAVDHLIGGVSDRKIDGHGPHLPKPAQTRLPR